MSNVELFWGEDQLFWGADELIWGTFDLPDEVETPGPPIYSVDLCDNFVRIGVASAFTLSAVERNLATGEWELVAPLSGLDLDADATIEDVDSIIVWDDSRETQVVFAGIIRATPNVDGGTIRRVTAEGTEVTFRGIDVYGLLALRQAWPTPSMAPPWDDSHDVRTGVGSTVAAGYIEDNIGASALAARQIDGLTVVDPGVGTSSTWSGRLQPLDELVGRVCRESGITVDASMTTPGSFSFSFRAPEDLSSRYILTDQGDLEELSQLVQPAAATYIIAAGQGELTDRSFAIATSGATGLDRVERIYENTNITTEDGLTRAASTQLELSAEDIAVDGIVAARAAQQVRYRTAYRLGDWLGIEVDGVRRSAQVEAVVITINAQREDVRPVLGRTSANDAVRLIRAVGGLESRFDNQIA